MDCSIIFYLFSKQLILIFQYRILKFWRYGGSLIRKCLLVKKSSVKKLKPGFVEAETPSSGNSEQVVEYFNTINLSNGDDQWDCRTVHKKLTELRVREVV